MNRYDTSIQRIKDFKEWDDDEMAEVYGYDFKREIGIDIACNDWQNASLKFPIKISHSKDDVYELCEPSNSDPNQGFD